MCVVCVFVNMRDNKASPLGAALGPAASPPSSRYQTTASRHGLIPSRCPSLNYYVFTFFPLFRARTLSFFFHYLLSTRDVAEITKSLSRQCEIVVKNYHYTE